MEVKLLHEKARPPPKPRRCSIAPLQGPMEGMTPALLAPEPPEASANGLKLVGLNMKCLRSGDRVQADREPGESEDAFRARFAALSDRQGMA